MRTSDGASRLPILTLFSAIALAAPLPAAGQATPAAHGSMPMPGPVSWRPFDKIPGAEWAILAGDPHSAGAPGALIDYVIRLRLPAGVHMPAHWHPRHEYPMLVSGEFRIGQGTRERCVPARDVVVGELGYAPAGMVHCGYAIRESVIQLMGPGAYEMTLVSPPLPPAGSATGRP